MSALRRSILRIGTGRVPPLRRKARATTTRRDPLAARRTVKTLGDIVLDSLKNMPQRSQSRILHRVTNLDAVNRYRLRGGPHCKGQLKFSPRCHAKLRSLRAERKQGRIGITFFWGTQPMLRMNLNCTNRHPLSPTDSSGSVRQWKISRRHHAPVSRQVVEKVSYLRILGHHLPEKGHIGHHHEATSRARDGDVEKTGAS